MNVDLIVGLGADRLNQCISTLFAIPNIRNSVFQGTETYTYEQTTYQLGWRIESAPVIQLRNPTDQEWSSSVKAGGITSWFVENAFMVFLGALHISLFDSKKTREATIPLTLIANANYDGHLMAANSVVIDRSTLSRADRYAADHVLIPKVLAAITQALNGLNVAPPSFAGVSLTLPTAAVINGKLVVGFNMVQHAQPNLNGTVVPDRSFFVIASQNLLQVAANYAATTEIQGKRFHKEGSEGAAGFSANYNANAVVDSVSVRPTGNPAVYRADVSIGMRAGGGISTPIDIIIDNLNPTKW